MKQLHNIPGADDGASAPGSLSSFTAENWLRLPKPGGRLEGLSRTTLTELAVPCAANKFQPPILSVLIKKRGAARGIRLINKKSLYEHLQDLANEQAQEMNDVGAKGGPNEHLVH